MPAIDYNAEIEAALEAAIFGAPVIVDHVKPGNRIATDKRGTAKLRHANAPADFCEILIARPPQRAERLQQTLTPTFGLGRDANCDYIVPIQCAFNVRYRYDSTRWIQITGQASEPEVLARRAIMAIYPRLGFNWMRTFTIDSTKKEPPDGTISEVTDSITFDLRLHRSQIT